MNRRFLFFLLAGIFLVAAPAVLADVYGEGLTLEASETTPIATIVAAPDSWKGKHVRVEGTVTDVCPMKGCWMSLRQGDAALRIKVDDDVIVFPKEAVDHDAVAEGVVDVQDLDRERWVSWQAHLAEERGETFDPASVGDGPYRLIQIRGSGAEIALDDTP